MSAVALGFRAQRGGSVVVGVTLEDGAPRVALSTFLATAREGDRLAFEPYHVAVEMADEAEAVEAVAEARRRQAAVAAERLSQIVGQLGAPATAALLINRAGWITDLLAYSRGAAEHPAVAEGLAVRDALRSAFGALDLPAIEVDEKSLPEAAALKLGLTAAEIDARLAGLGARKPWRKEQKLACLAAWVAAAGG